MPEKLWSIEINFKGQGDNFHFAFTSDEQSLFNMLRTFYGTIEARIKTMADSPAGKRPEGLVDDALVLLRCLVFNKLQAHDGKFLKISTAR